MTVESHEQTIKRSWSGRMPSPGMVLLVLVSYVPLLLTKPGKVGADTKTYLYLNPGRLLSRAPFMWDPNIGLGTVTHQNIGYLWPMGPYYFVMDTLGLPDWAAQRLWMGSVIVAAGLGVRWMLRELRWEGPGLTVASFAYAFSPYILEYAARISVILLPWAGLPWLIGLSVRCLRRQDWKSPAIFALVTLTVGGVNATSLILVMVGPVLWFFYATFVLREVRFGQALVAGLKISLLTFITSTWWLAGLMIQGRYGIPILRYTETYRTVAEASLSTELLRGLGYWFFYGQDGLGAWTASSRAYVQNKMLLAVSFLLPGLGFLAGLTTRWRTRLYFALLVAAGLILGVGAHPWDSPSPYGSIFKAWSRSDLGLSFRSTPRAAPLTILGLAVFLGAGIGALANWRPKLTRPVSVALVALTLVNMVPLFRGQFVDRNLLRDETVPEYWTQAADALDSGDTSTRVLEFPGIDFAAYRWGNTVDPIMPGLTDRNFVARELIPYGTPASANLLNAVDAPFQSGRADPSVLAPISRMMGIGDILFRADLQYERYLTPRPRETWAQLLSAAGLGPPLEFGPSSPNEASPQLPVDDAHNYAIPLNAADPPAVSIFPVLEARPMVRTMSSRSPVLLSGDGDGMVALAAAGLMDPSRAVLYSASFAGDRKGLDAVVDEVDSSLVITDTNRRQARRWGSVRDNAGYTEQVGEEPLVVDPTDNRLDVFPGAGDDTRTVAEQVGGAKVRASGYGNAVTYTPGDRAVNAMDGDETTAWRVAAFAKAEGEFLDVELRKPVTTDHIQLLQGQGYKNRWMTVVSLRFDSGEPVRVNLAAASRTSPGQTIAFPRRTFERLRVTVEATDIGPQPTYRGISDVGIAELRIPGVDPVTEVIRPPVDLLDHLGRNSLDHDLTYILSRRAGNQAETLAADEEPRMLRKLTNPVTRSYRVYGKGRMAVDRSDEEIDRALGLRSASEGGLSASSSARMPGTLASRARSAVDGDPTTAYITPVNGPFQQITVEYPHAVSVDSLAITAMVGEKYSVPTRVIVAVDGTSMGSFDVSSRLPVNADGTEEMARLLFDTPKLTGRKFTVSIEAVEERHSRDWFSGTPTLLPVAINELGLPPLQNPAPTEPFDSGCREDLLGVMGKQVPLRITGTFGDAAGGKILHIESCGSPLVLSAGEADLATVAGRATGLDLDLIALTSVAGGDAGGDPFAQAETDSGTAQRPDDGQVAPSTEHRRTGRLSYTLDIEDATQPYWVVLGQSLSDGWTATTSEGVDLGRPTLINGFANGWLVDPAIVGKSATIELRWTPQRSVWIGLGLSAVGLLICLALVLWPSRGRSPDSRELHPPVSPRHIAFHAPPVTLKREEHSVQFIGIVSISASMLAWFFGGPYVGVVIAVGTVVALLSHGGRWAVRMASLALFGAAAGVVVLKEAVRSYPIDFKWVEHFEITHAWAIAATFLLVVSAAVDTLTDGADDGADDGDINEAALSPPPVEPGSRDRSPGS